MVVNILVYFVLGIKKTKIILIMEKYVSKISEEICDIIRAEHNGVDLNQDDDLMVIQVCKQTKKGDVISIGSVSLCLAMTSPEQTNKLIDKIKFGRFKTYRDTQEKG